MIQVDLPGVQETQLGNLGRRAAAARRGILDDPRAIELVAQLDHDFAHFSRGVRLHAVRVSTFDTAVRRFLDRQPGGTVVALGEGLETQFWRVDNGRVRWLSVDLAETLALRRQALPDGPRRSSHVGSALDLRWVDELDRDRPILITAQGLLPYFRREQVHALIGGIAERLPGSVLVFDVVPEVMLDLVRRTSGPERDLAVELWTWLFSRGERDAIRAIPGVDDLRDLAPPVTRNPASLGVAAVSRLPVRLRYAVPTIMVVRARFRAASAA